jgi:hypothetical protein
VQDLVNVQDFSSSVVAGDWAPAFAEAFKKAFTDRRSGVFVPASPAPYTVKKPGPQRPSINLRGIDPGDGTLHPLTNFTLAGEGSRSVIQMTGSGGGGSWALIHVGGHADDITIRDLFLDGMYGSDTSPADLDEQTHLIRIGGSNAVSGGARNVRILNCVLTRAFGDGIAILPLAVPADAGEEVSHVRIAFCNFIRNHRSGISNQRSARLVQILHNYFEGDPDQHGQAIDLEPTGNVPDSGPSGYLILG